MPFHLKVNYDGVTRKIPVVNKPIPSFDELLNQVRALYGIEDDISLILEKILYSPDGHGQIMLARRAFNEVHWHTALAAQGLAGRMLDRAAKGYIKLAVVLSPLTPWQMRRRPFESIKRTASTTSSDAVAPVAAATTVAAPSFAAASVPAQGRLDQMLRETQTTLETLRRLSPPSATPSLPKAHAHSASASCCTSSGPAPPPFGVHDLKDALLATSEELKHFMTTFLTNYAQSTAEGVPARDAAAVSTPPAAAAASSSSSEGKETDVWLAENGVQLEVWCDGCSQRIGSLRFKCLQCPNYDLCASCLPSLVNSTSAHPPQHVFKTVYHPLLASHLNAVPALAPVQASPAAPARRSTPFSIRHNASCDFCDNIIDGERWKCLSCPDFDSCQSCSSIIADQHPGHSFVKISDPAAYMDFSSSAPRAVHKNIFCNACENLIVGVRYRCVHPSCDDYDLCETCEAAPIARHPASHPLLKIKTPMIIDAHTSFDDEPVRAFHPVRPSCEGVSTPFTLANAPTPARASTPVAVNEPLTAPATPPTTSLWEEDYTFDRLTSQPDMTQTSSTPITRQPSFVEDLFASAPEVQEPSVSVVEDNEEKLLLHHSVFVEDVTVEDGQNFPAGARFVKVWKLKNAGTSSFPCSTMLVHESGAPGHEDCAEVGPVCAGDTFEVSVPFRAPDAPGRYLSFWRLKSTHGEPFGDRVWTDFVVVDPSSSGSSSLSSSSIVMPAAVHTGSTNSATNSFHSANTPAAATTTTDPPRVQQAPTVSSVSTPSSVSSRTHDDDEDEGVSDVDSIADSDVSAWSRMEREEGIRGGAGGGEEDDFVVIHDDE